MAITTYRETAAPGWASTSVIYQLESAFQKLGWHGGTVSGIVTGISAYSGQSVVGTSSTDFNDVRPKSAPPSGVGAGDTCSFAVFRNFGSVNAVYVNRGGHGYQDGQNVVLDGEAIGGGNDMTVTILCDETNYGSTSTFYDKDVTSGSTYPWGVLRMENDNNKVYGDTYFGFQASNTKLYFSTGSSFMPYKSPTVDYLNLESRYGNSFRGQQYLDTLFDPTLDGQQLDASTLNTNIDIAYFNYASSNSFTLELNVFRSGIDNNFAIFSFRHPDKSSSSINDNTYGTFFLHKFSHSLLNLDEMFLGSMTYLDPSLRDMSNAHHEIRTTTGNSISQQYWVGRNFMMGWATGTYSGNVEAYYRDTLNSSAYPRQLSVDERRQYYRTNDNASHPMKGNMNLTDYTNKTPDVLNHNAVYKGIPISSQIIPCPYYLPDDFVLIDFNHASPSQNIQQYDTITISEGSEVYTVIDGAYNQTTRTRGILLCARTT
jgi:hypothetical protein